MFHILAVYITSLLSFLTSIIWWHSTSVNVVNIPPPESKKEIVTIVDTKEPVQVKQEKKIEEKYDLLLDSSFQKFIWQNNTFNVVSYEPWDLISIVNWKYISVWKNGMQLRKEAKENLDKLSEAFYQKFWVKVYLVSAHRNYKYQLWIERNDPNCIKTFLCAKAWHSEHQSWLAVDIFQASTKEDFLSNKKYVEYFNWLKENAHKFWFHNSYQNGVAIEGYYPEPWHWRYLGKDLAEKLSMKWKTFTQYFYEEKN